MQDVKLEAAAIHETGLITQLAGRIWKQHYPAIISMTQINYMLEKMYSPQSLGEQVSKGHRFFFIVLHGEKIGFLSVHHEGNGAWFLHKFYVDQELAAKGIGSAALLALKNDIHPAKLTLTVNRQNYKSINFYFKHGFKIDRVADFDIGNGYVMDDFVMTWAETKTKD